MPPTSPSRSTDREGVAKQVIAYVAETDGTLQAGARCDFVEAIPRTPSGKIVHRGLIERERLAAHTMRR
jgi:acyl-coenzyme A synthetase/AMP-(fatty) acid ligase